MLVFRVIISLREIVLKFLPFSLEASLINQKTLFSDISLVAHIISRNTSRQKRFTYQTFAEMLYRYQCSVVEGIRHVTHLHQKWNLYILLMHSSFNCLTQHWIRNLTRFVQRGLMWIRNSACQESHADNTNVCHVL